MDLHDRIMHMSEHKAIQLFTCIFLVCGAVVGLVIGLIAQGVCAVFSTMFAWVNLWWYAGIVGAIGALFGFFVSRNLEED